MEKIILVFSTVLIMNFLTACSEETHTVAWYKEHPEILKKEIEKCKTKTLAELATDKHCAVIKQAEKEVFDDRQINAPVPTFK